MKQSHIQLLLVAVAALFCACNNDIDAPVIPTYDTTIVITRDTTVTPTQKLDTTSRDTVITDTVINLDNNLVVLAYVAQYGKKLPDPMTITHTIYMGGELYVVDNVYQKIGIHFNGERFSKFVALKKKNPDLKVMLSISHVCDLPDNKQGGSYSALSKSAAQRQHFAQDCANLCDTYGLDGIDINWELPGLSESGAACDPLVDTDNFTLLMRDLRAALGPDRLLTYAGHTRPKERSGNGWRFMDNTAAAQYVDWVNVMCYGMGVAPKPHNAISAEGVNPGVFTDCTHAWSSYLATGFPMDHFVLGVPFYSRQPKGGAVTGEWYYYTIKTMLRNYPNMYRVNNSKRSTWGVPYVEKLVNGVWTMYGSYEDEESIAKKSEWLQQKQMRGMMWWENEGDDSQHTLQHAAWNALKTKTLHDTTFIFTVDTINVMDTVIIEKRDTIITKSNPKK